MVNYQNEQKNVGKKRTHQHIYPHMSKANKIPMDFRKLNVSKLRGAKNE